MLQFSNKRVLFSAQLLRMMDVVTTHIPTNALLNVCQAIPHSAGKSWLSETVADAVNKLVAGAVNKLVYPLRWSP